MKYRCARCHTTFSSDEAPEACPTCRAESGLEPVEPPPMPMRLFATVLATAAVVAAVGAVVARVQG